jgi:hypothetical protein
MRLAAVERIGLPGSLDRLFERAALLEVVKQDDTRTFKS